MSAEDIELATVELLGALAYGQLRSFEITSRAIRLAPDAQVADDLAEFAHREYTGYVLLRDHLTEHTDLAAGVMDRQKPHFDGYFDRVVLDDWFGACAFFALGLPLAADFGRELAPMLDVRTAEVVIGALADRTSFEAFARAQLGELSVDEDRREQARALVADLLGRALTGFQGVISDTDALKVLLEADRDSTRETAEGRVKRLAMSVMAAHRRRVLELGLEDLDSYG